jgi:CheY-like chemotaxis protein
MKLSEARILFVDDEPFLLEIFAQWISGETPCQVTTAADGQEALETLKTNDYWSARLFLNQYL